MLSGMMKNFEICEEFMRKENITKKEQNFIRAVLRIAMPISAREFDNPEYADFVIKTSLISRFMIFDVKVV